jgi:hypothetical protein
MRGRPPALLKGSPGRTSGRAAPPSTAATVYAVMLADAVSVSCMSPRFWGTGGERWGTAGKETEPGTGRADRGISEKAWTIAWLSEVRLRGSNPFSRSSSAPVSP